MFFRHSLDKLIYPLIGLGILTYTSYRPKYHLRTQMPAAFFPAATSSGSGRQGPERRIAEAYWKSACSNIQWKFPYGSPLPLDAPSEFQVDARLTPAAQSDPATRLLYWHRLHQVWPLKESWEPQYEWDFSWAHDPLTSAGQWLRDHIGRMFSVH
jgi:hypothetical protein